jgi:hypothetical protein
MDKLRWTVVVLLSVVAFFGAWAVTAKMVKGSEGRLNEVITGVDERLTGLEEKTIGNLQRANEAYEKAELLDGRIVDLEDDICDVIVTQDQTTEKIRLLQESAGVVLGRITTAESRIDAVEVIAGSAESLAKKANNQNSARITNENREYLRMVNYIRDKNSGFEIGLKSDEEIGKLLTNGVWDIEDHIKKEYDRLITLTAQAGLNASMTAYDRAEEAKLTADTALVTGETAVEAVQTIAEQPNRFLGRSVNKETKKRISSILGRRNR